MKQLTRFSVNYPVTILMLVLAIGLLGYISFTKIGIDLFPDLNNPKLYIEVSAGERPPEEMENLFVEAIESQAIRQSDVREVSSITTVGYALLTIEYSWSKDMDEAFLDLQKAVNTFAQSNNVDEINISQYDPNAAPVMVIALENDSISDLNEIRKVAENYIKNELIRLEGVADVKLTGEQENEVVIETNPYLLEAFNLTANNIASQINAYNTNVSGGSIEEQGTRYSIKGLSMVSSPNDLKKIIVGTYAEELEDGTSGETTPVYLSDVATIKTINKDPDSYVRYNGNYCIGLSVYKEPKFNTVKAVEELKEKLKTIEKALPGYKLDTVKDQGNFIDESIMEVRDSALYGIILAVIVIFIFLRQIRPTLVISIAIPISIVATFVLMYFLGLSFNIMTLGGLALGAGMLVDNAIIVMENIYRHMEKGKSVFKAAIKGTSEVGGAITASTLTTIVVFLPIVYIHGASGELFKDQAWTVAFSLISSLFVAILVMPVLVTKIFKKNSKITHKTIQVKSYRKLLEFVLKHRFVVVGFATFLVIISYLLLPKIGSEFMPGSSSDNFTVDIKLPQGTALKSTTSTTQQIESILWQALPNQIESIYTENGISSNSQTQITTSSENEATIFIQLTKNGEQHYESVLKQIDQLLAQNDQLEFTFEKDETSLQTILGNSDAPVVVEVIGDELDVISEITEQTKEIIASIPGLYNIETSIENGAPEIDIAIDRVRAGIYGINISTIITQVQNRLEGTNAGEFEENGEMKDITIKQPKVSINELENLEIKSNSAVYRLTDLATIQYNKLPREIHRRNQNRIGKITASTDNAKPLDQLVSSIEEKLATIPLPNNYRYQIAGEEVKRTESMGDLTFALILAIILVYMVMAAQFESLINPFVILLTIPLALVGVVFTFLVIGKPFNIMAFIGMIMLIGIAVNDSIIFIDAINKLRAKGMAKQEAILQAGQQRIRPIIMTSLTTILALFPLTLGFGSGASLRSPMAWAVIGGLITSTFLTLIVIPSVYWILDFRKDQITVEKN